MSIFSSKIAIAYQPGLRTHLLETYLTQQSIFNHATFHGILEFFCRVYLKWWFSLQIHILSQNLAQKSLLFSGGGDSGSCWFGGSCSSRWCFRSSTDGSCKQYGGILKIPTILLMWKVVSLISYFRYSGLLIIHGFCMLFIFNIFLNLPTVDFLQFENVWVHKSLLQSPLISNGPQSYFVVCSLSNLLI